MSNTATSKESGSQFTHMRNRLEFLRIQSEVAELEVKQAKASLPYIQEGLSRFLNYDNIVNPSEWMTDGFGRQPGFMIQTQAREEGRNRPMIETEQDLIEMRSFARAMVDLNPYMKGVLEDLTNYVIGTGFVYTASGKKNRKAPKELVDLVQDVLDEFDEDNLWCGNYEREIFRRGSRDGEAPVRVHPAPEGHSKVRVVEPEYIRQPHGEVKQLEQYLAYHYPMLMNWDAEPSSWTFGVHTSARDIEDHLGYFVEWNPSGGDWEYVPACDIVFIRANVDRNVKRGLSDFYPVDMLSDDAMKLVRNIAKGATIQASIAFVETFEKGVSAVDINNLAEAALEYTKSTRTANGNISATDVTGLGAGSKLSVPSGRTYQAGPMGQSSAPVYLDVLQAVLRAVGVRWSMPEYMISGDASNGNYASSVEAGAPFTKACEAAQFFYKTHFRKIKWLAVKHAFNAGRFSAYVRTFAELKRLVGIDIEVPDVRVRNAVEETNRRKILWECGGLSMQTWMSQEGEDYDQERENIRSEKSDGIVTTPSIIPGVSVAVPASTPAVSDSPAAIETPDPQTSESARVDIPNLIKDIFAEFKDYP